VVDEADKAQLEVVCVLKGIVDGELALPDGRIIRNRPADFDQHKVLSSLANSCFSFPSIFSRFLYSFPKTHTTLLTHVTIRFLTKN
jgi:hypothetical protein